MREYRQRVRFQREFFIKARDAAHANAQLEQLIDRVEFDADVSHEGFQEFEDEPVECPICNGNGVVGEDGQTCDRCKGDGSIPFSHHDSAR